MPRGEYDIVGPDGERKGTIRPSGPIRPGDGRALVELFVGMIVLGIIGGIGAVVYAAIGGVVGDKGSIFWILIGAFLAGGLLMNAESPPLRGIAAVMFLASLVGLLWFFVVGEMPK
jgi:hypothetical protein